MPLWKLTLSYDGTDFFGWQVQPGLRTIQGELGRALLRLTGETTLPQGSGRTDAGVHAAGQVASVALTAPIPAANLQRALNELLPRAIRVLRVEEREPPFHARHSARWKTYEYRIFPLRPSSAGDGHGPAMMDAVREPLRVCDPMQARYVWEYGYALDLDALNRAAAQVCGTHDFTSFAAAGGLRDEVYTPSDPMPDYPVNAPTPCRTLSESRWSMRDDLLVYRVRGSGFLQHMVRNLVGTFVQVRSGRLVPEAIGEILGARSRSAAGPTAPARGLILDSVEY